MVNIRIANDDDKKAWNEVAEKAENSTYAHTWEWKEVIERGFGVESLCLVAEDNTGEIIGIYPGFLQPLKIKNIEFISKRFKVLESPFRTTWDYGGPCVLPDAGEKVLEELVIGMERLAKEKGAISLRISPFEGDALKNTILKRGYRISERLTSVIDLTMSEEELWKNCRKKWCQYVNKAKKNGVLISEENSSEAIKGFYNTLASVHKRENIYLPALSFFENMLNVLIPKNIATLRIARIGDKIIGGDILLHHNGLVVERYRGVFDDALKLHTSYLMVWSAISQSKAKGYNIYDLGSMPSDETSGIYFFKSGWKGEIKHTDWYVKDIKFKNSRALIRKIKSTII